MSSAVSKAVKTAKAALEAKDYEKAKNACENALILDATNVNLLLLHGTACANLGDVSFGRHPLAGIPAWLFALCSLLFALCSLLFAHCSCLCDL